MITCKECKLRLLPEDPSVPTGIYHHSSCDYFCDKPTYYRDLETKNEPQVVEHIHRHSDMRKKDFNLLQQTALKVDYLLKGISNKRVDKQGIKYVIK